MKSKVIEIPIDEARSVSIKKRFPATALSRLDEKAPRLVEQMTDMVMSPVRRKEVEQKLSAAKVGEEARQNVVVTSFELARTTVDELDALHEFCVALTQRVDGFVDWEGDPFVWKDKEKPERLDLFDCDVPNATKVTMYLFAYLVKNGMDPEALRKASEESWDEEDKSEDEKPEDEKPEDPVDG